MKKTLTIVKIGGTVIDDEAMFGSFIGAFCQIPGDKVLVHGGGNKATELAARLNLETQMVEGRRVTDQEMLEVVVMTYAGLINKKVVAALQASSCNAVGLSGADAKLLQANRRPPLKGIDYGWVGDIYQVNTSFLTALLGQHIIPVISPISYASDGQLLNTNADTVTSEIAGALASKYSVELIFCFDKKGVLKDVENPASVIRKLVKSEYLELKKKGIIVAGMIPKLDNAFKTLEKGVKQISMLDVEGLSQKYNGSYHGYTIIY
jgi:acetylglutamate kinase